MLFANVFENKLFWTVVTPSSTFYELLFHTMIVLFASFLCLQFEFIIFNHKNISKIDTGSQFHQHFTSHIPKTQVDLWFDSLFAFLGFSCVKAFYWWVKSTPTVTTSSRMDPFFQSKLVSWCAGLQLLRHPQRSAGSGNGGRASQLSPQRDSSTLAKRATGVNFINVLRTAFTPVAPQSVIIQSSYQYLFTLLRSTSVKAVCKTLVKLSPGFNFDNILHTAFTLVDPESAKNTDKSSVSFYTFGICERKSCT